MIGRIHKMTHVLHGVETLLSRVYLVTEGFTLSQSWAVPRMGPRVPFAPALLTLSPHITLHIYFIFFFLLYLTCVMVNKAVKKKKTNGRTDERCKDRSDE